MSVRVVERVDGWDERPFRGGYDALRDLAADEFSGVVRAGGAECYLTVGTIVGVRMGTIEDFADGSGTAHVSPHPALPLLAIMQDAGAEVRAQYYTEDTPISEVDRTLSSGGFTGFLELSENVLSGDYFLAYHGGESMSVAFVGESERLITDDEAFETADDEVGIYKVRQVDVEPVEIPEGDGASGSAGAGGASSTDTADATGAADDAADAADATDDGDVDEADDAAADPAPADETEPADDGTDDAVAAHDTGTATASSAGETAAGEATDAEAGAATTAAGEPDAGETAADATGDDRTDSTADAADRGEGAGAERASRSAEADASRADATPSADTSVDRSQTSQDATAGSQGSSGGDRPTQPRSAVGGGASQASGSNAAAGGDGQLRSSGGQAGDLETRAVPSLDPDQTKVPSRENRSGPGGSPADGGAVPSAETGDPPDGRAAGGEPEPARTAEEGSPESGAGADEPPAGDAATAAEGDLASLEAEVERLEAELAETTEERDDLRAELEAVREERDELQAEVDRLDSEMRRLEEQFGAASDADRRMTPVEAIEGTNLFVDYDSKGNATLEKAHGGSESLEEVAENLQIGVHTEFDQDGVAVGGQAFEEFLRETLHYRFAEWVVADLLFEIRDTGHAEALADLYDAIPEIRRVEFNGTVDVEYVEDGQEKGGREQFDVIFRHRMGDPLVVANLNDARDPATGGMMDTLVTAAERVGQTEDGLSAAFLVTSSYFESQALETVSEATRGGLLSRDSRASFVNLSRKSGYHLCLTAAREGNFHMEVPEL